MASWTVLTVAAAEQEIRDLPPDLRSRFLHIAEMLEQFGPQKLGMRTSALLSRSFGRCG